MLDSEVSAKMRAWMRIPDAALGAIADGATSYLPWLDAHGDGSIGPGWSCCSGWMSFRFIASAILVLMQAFVVGSYCFLCLVTAALSLLLIWLSYDEVWSCLVYHAAFGT